MNKPEFLQDEGHLCDRYGSRWPAALGFLTGLPCFILLGFIREDSVEQVFMLCALLVVIGLVIAMIDPSLMSDISRTLDDIEAERPGTFGASGAYAQAYAIFATWWAAGTMVGPLWASFMQEHYGWRATTLTLGLFCGITAIPTALLLGNASHKVLSNE
jgi:MFS family permease